MKCYTAPKYEVEYAVASEASVRTGISGDTAVGFEVDGNFYSVISDGMGSGEGAKRTSGFVADYLKSTLIPDTPTIKEAVSTLSAILRRRRDECAATVDVFSFDLYTGEGRFLKCGAATSYIKRGDSVFAVKCTSTPIGLLRGVDADEMMSDIRGGDIVVMMSDGVSESPDEAAWLIEFLARPTKLAPSEYAESILALAKEKSGDADDMTVAVAYVHER
jgi:stage II sporulation protein E